MVIKNFRLIVSGNASAKVLFTDVPLSFWGGVDPSTGKVIDVHHPLTGENTAGKILCFPYDRGSCSGSGVMLELIRCGAQPAGLVCIEAEAVLAVGPIIGERLYHRSLPIRTVSEEDFHKLQGAHRLCFTEDAILVDEDPDSLS